MKILTILGARPQFIKAAVVSRAIRQNNAMIQEEIIHTGQHYDYGMSQVFFDEMDIPTPTVNLHVGSGNHGAATADMLKGIEAEILQRKPDGLLVYGDTNSTLAGALAASKHHIPVMHIEAGERSYNRQMPEEINRVLTDHVSTQLFCCSEKSKSRLAGEGITKNVFVVGDVMYDAFLAYLPKAIWPKNLKKLSSPFALTTLHRAQNTDDPARLKSIFDALSSIPEQIVLPLHPRTLKMVRSNNIQLGHNIHLLEPVSYFEILGLLKDCSYVLTDSGGLQKEAYYAGKKCVVLRDETEWTELVEAGINKVAGIEKQPIMDAASWAKKESAIQTNIYGNGTAGKQIVSFMSNM
ncbi:MAG: UDP-N-acetylglucosamine 2-epimerase (non-hydrolyzing) [Gammaproteobacteria bacterium]|nr:UDP-N-acetylglucosamine 2-epimerase (non-hydrolyzing) [Gammaproteobacteria bacterium]